MNESSPTEILGVIIPSVFLIFISTNLSTIFHLDTKKQHFWILLEFVIIVLPQIFTVTILVPYIKEVLFFSIFLSLISIILISISDAHQTIEKKQHEKGFPFITNVRSTINLITVIAILAVDFKLFPNQFKKTYKYGYSLMDVGVGLFVFANAIVAPEVKGYRNSLSKTLFDAIPLLILGFGRYVSTTLTNYSVSVTEYGKHWNFFMTLAVTRILSSLVLYFVKPKFSMITGILILAGHEFLLQNSFSEYVFGDSPRDNLFSANREGIVSSLGFVGLYFLSLAVGVLLNLKDKELPSKITTLVKLAVCSMILFPVTFYLEHNYFISRRLANAAYCFWILSIGVFMTMLLYIIELSQAFFYKKFGYSIHIHVPLLLEAINYNGLLFFLVANVLTGLVNMTLTTLTIGTVKSIVILIIYMCLNCIVAFVLYKVRINLKFIIYKIAGKSNVSDGPNKSNI